MYAVISSGGKQERVEVGSTVAVELLSAQVGEVVELTPLLLVDGEDVAGTPDALAGASVAARVTGTTKGPKIVGFTYRPKARGRRRFGHRQSYTTLEITEIRPAKGAGAAPRSRARRETA